MRATSVKRSSIALARWAVVNRVSPPPGDSAWSIMTTRRPAFVSRHAVVSPAIPAPTIQTSHTMSPGNGPGLVSRSGSLQAGTVDCLDMDSSSMAASCAESPSPVTQRDRERAEDPGDRQRPVGRDVKRLAREDVRPPGDRQFGWQKEGRLAPHVRADGGTFFERQ